MTPSDYRKIVEDSKKELEDLLIKQEEIERRIARLKQAILGLAPLIEEEPTDQGMYGTNDDFVSEWLGLGTGMTDVCRNIFKASSSPLTPVEIKQKLLDMGVDLTKHKNIMASVHSVLKRLAEKGEIVTKDNGLSYERSRLVDRIGKAEAIRNSLIARGRLNKSRYD